MEVHRHLDEELDTLRSSVLRLGGEAEAALIKTMRALTERDSAVAQEALEHDAEINALHNQIFHELIEMMTEEPSTATRNARLLFVAKHLERIGDYVTDICELTVYMAEAAIIKHTH